VAAAATLVAATAATTMMKTTTVVVVVVTAAAATRGVPPSAAAWGARDETLLGRPGTASAAKPAPAAPTARPAAAAVAVGETALEMVQRPTAGAGGGTWRGAGWPAATRRVAAVGVMAPRGVRPLGPRVARRRRR
jgi:hypothetical protein